MQSQLKLHIDECVRKNIRAFSVVPLKEQDGLRDTLLSNHTTLYDLALVSERAHPVLSLMKANSKKLYDAGQYQIYKAPRFGVFLFIADKHLIFGEAKKLDTIIKSLFLLLDHEPTKNS